MKAFFSSLRNSISGKDKDKDKQAAAANSTTTPTPTNTTSTPTTTSTTTTTTTTTSTATTTSTSTTTTPPTSSAAATANSTLPLTSTSSSSPTSVPSSDPASAPVEAVTTATATATATTTAPARLPPAPSYFPLTAADKKNSQYFLDDFSTLIHHLFDHSKAIMTEAEYISHKYEEALLTDTILHIGPMKQMKEMKKHTGTSSSSSNTTTTTTTTTTTDSPVQSKTTSTNASPALKPQSNLQTHTQTIAQMTPVQLSPAGQMSTAALENTSANHNATSVQSTTVTTTPITTTTSSPAATTLLTRRAPHSEIGRVAFAARAVNVELPGSSVVAQPQLQDINNQLRSILQLGQDFSRQCDSKEEARKAGTVPTLARLDVLRTKLNNELAAAKEANTKEYEANMKSLHTHYQNMMKQTQENGVPLPNQTPTTSTDSNENTTPVTSSVEASS